MIRALLLPLLTGLALASFTPELSLINPRGGQLGTEIKVRLHGKRLDSPRELLFQRPGIECLGFEWGEAEKDPPLFAKLRIAPDAPLGEHPIRLRTDGGISYLRNFWVGQFPTVSEKEPNDDFDQPQKLESGVTVQGVAKTEDEDFYAVTLQKGQPLAVEIEAMRLGRTFFDAYVAILDPKGFELAACDDASLLYTDAFAAIVAPEDGEYRIVVREAAYEGNDSSQYRLHLGDFPRPSAVFPTGARPGETLSFRFIGDPAGEIVQEITIPEDASGRFPLFAERRGVRSPSPNWIEVSPLPHVAEVEPNAGAKPATVAPPAPCALHGELSEEKDHDWFRFTAKKDRNYDIQVLARHLRSPLDSVISLRDGSGKHLESNDDQNAPDSLLRWKCPADGEYLLQIRDKLERSGPAFTYRVEIRERRAEISASLPVAERNNSQARKMICVPRGNLYATPVNITRANHRTPIAFEAVSLPDGVSIEVPPLPQDLNNFPLLFRATADAPLAGGYHRFRLRPTGDKAPRIEGLLEEEIHLIEINNQGPYHTCRSEQIAVAVIEEAPYHIHLESPPTSIVPRGTLKLKVRAERREGFEGKITLRLLWRPPGIGAPETVPLEAKAGEALYEINANPDAPVGEWRLAILGEAETPKGPVIVSSEFITLKVVEPWLTASIDLGATEQGRDVPVVAQLEHARDFPGEAKAELVGLPHGASTVPQTFTKDSASLTFPVTVAEDAVVGKHSGLFLRIHIPEGGGTVLHQCAQGGTLRIDKPRPQVAEKKPEPEKPAAAKPPVEKPLSRLEQLRQAAQ